MFCQPVYYIIYIQVNVPHVTPVDRFAAKKFSKQHHLQALN